MGGEVFFDQDSSNQDSSNQDSSVQCFGMSRAMLIDVEDVEEVGEGRKKERRKRILEGFKHQIFLPAPLLPSPLHWEWQK
jgi:hypothetical protein